MLPAVKHSSLASSIHPHPFNLLSLASNERTHRQKILSALWKVKHPIVFECTQVRHFHINAHNTHTQREKETHTDNNMHLQFPTRTNRTLKMSAAAAMIFQNPCMKSMSKYLFLPLVRPPLRHPFLCLFPFFRITFTHILQHYSSHFFIGRM